MPSSTSNGKPNGRFELPQLTPVNYSLTDGTDIPPPPDSPVEEAPPPPAPKPKDIPLPDTPTGESVTSPTTTNGHSSYNGRGRTPSADQPPLSPASTTRPGSIRRFLSRRSLNSNYTNGTNHNKSTDDLSQYERPGSSLEKPKRSTSWFRRFGSSSNGNAGNRTSIVYEQEENKKPVEKKGPPPPKLPELGSLKAGGFKDGDEGSLGGGDIFKNIK